MTEHEPDRIMTRAEQRAAYSAQIHSLSLRPWEEPPCVQDPHVPLRGSPAELKAMRLLRQMLAAGISRWHPDPLKALAEAEMNKARPRRRTMKGGYVC